MEERIKEHTTFYTTIAGNKYKCYMNAECNGFKISHYIIIKKLKKYFPFIVEWKYRFYIGTDKVFGDNCGIHYTCPNSDIYYSIDDVKNCCERAIREHDEGVERKKQKKLEAKNFKHKKEI